MPSNRRLIIAAVVLTLVGLFEAWFLGLHLGNLVHGESHGDLIDAYTEALAAGQSHLGVVRNGVESTFTTLDTSSHDGRYYVYYGIGPFALVLAPWKWLTNTYLEGGVCIVAALMLGYGGYGWALLLAVRENQSPFMGRYLLPAALLTLVAASGTQSLLDTAAIHQLESSAAFASVGLSIGCLATACSFNRRRIGFLTAASFFAAFTMACRPNCFPVVATLIAAILYFARREKLPMRPNTALFRVVAPVLVVAICLAVWNSVRFGNPFEFGMRYGTGPTARPAIAAYSVQNIPYNLHRYLLGRPRIGQYFPFIDGVRDGPISIPAGIHEGVDQVYGCLWLFPVLGFAALALWKRRPFVVPLFIGAAGNLMLLAGLGFGTYRYPVDFLGPLSFAAALGIVSIADLPIRSLRIAAGAVLAPLLAFSAVSSVCLATSISRTHSLFDTARPQDFARLGFVFNQAAYRVESLLGSGPGTIRLTIQLPDGRSGKTEPLLVTGEPGLQDFIYLYYTGPNILQVGFSGKLMSTAINLDFGKPHVVDIALGTLLPPDDHPLVQSLPPSAVSNLRRRLRVTIDGTDAINGSFELHPIRSRLFYGSSPDDPAFGKAFTGRIERIERIPIAGVSGTFGP